MAVYFISDTHFDHKKVIEYSKRPFASVEEMNETLIKNWNSVVKKEDIVWFLGDFSLTKVSRMEYFVSRLHGDKRMVLGNHDQYSIKRYQTAGFTFVSRYPIVLKNKFILSHAPMVQDNDSEFINIYGHVHEKPSIKNEHNICVCVEQINYTPIELEIFNKG